MTDLSAWPEIPYGEWQDTCRALHLFTQIVGKYRLSRSPWVSHSWHATLYVSPAGLTTGAIPFERGSIELAFDFQKHIVAGTASDGRHSEFPLEPMSVADFFSRTAKLVTSLGGEFDIHPQPSEMPGPVPFAKDTDVRPYQADAVSRYHDALCRISQVFHHFRTGFIGKVSPVHVFWGAFDLAVTRFSGRQAPLHPGGIPNLPDSVTREAYSHEVSSAGFWPGGGGVDEAMFYSYAYPSPAGFADGSVRPDAAQYNEALGEYLLPYEAVRSSQDPEATLLEFLESTYALAADLGRWDRQALECERGRPLRPRSLSR